MYQTLTTAPPVHVAQVEPPPEALALTTLARVDYADAFRVEAGVERSGLAWARAMIEDAPPAVRLRLLASWTALGLRLGPPSPRGRVLGWPIRRDTGDHALLGTWSWLGMRGELLFARRPGGLLFATLLGLHTPVARGVWTRVAPGHQATVRSLLQHAAARESRG